MFRAILRLAFKFLSIQAQDFIEENSIPGRWSERRCAFLSIQAQDFIEEGTTFALHTRPKRFLSIQAQDFIEDTTAATNSTTSATFLSIQAQDFIEENWFDDGVLDDDRVFLSIQAQDFIEESLKPPHTANSHIPEHSSSGLH